ncbi:hypothetical protein [Ottowia sp.]|uniref:hypothetical protein n=1 Tax=Ottowia sp. TaxID=1898956 RepID=UPI0025E5B97B|nr:hypothetical protein [Ottowia sp.]MBK6616325.1 hypothetical protein [Ottowia sp.]
MTSESDPGSAANFEVGEVVRDFCDPASGLRGLVVRGGMSWCAYVGAPNEHALHGFEELRFDCHHGVNYTNQGEDSAFLPHGWYWWGWDYAHAGDATIMPPELAQFYERLAAGRKLKVWTLDEVAEEVLDVLMSLRVAIEANEKLATVALKRAVPASKKQS